MLPVLKTVSPQAADVYKLLGGGRVLSARDIADELDILPHAVYRVAKKLINMGMIEEVEGYPVRYRALPAQTAMSLYLIAAAQNFKREFGLNKSVATSRSDAPTISLLKDRPNMLRRGQMDARAARSTIDVIVSGHEVPEETFLAYQKAILSGVKVRKIIHQKGQVSDPLIERWKNIGVDMRYLPDLEIRMLIHDKRIVYITSFDAKNHLSAFGVRFDYVPLALQMTALFEQNWQKAIQL